MPGSPHRLSPSVEDYLKAVFALTRREEAASTSALAEALAVQPSSVTGMVKRLAGEGLLEHVPYRGVSLTAVGQREALRILRRHRVLETYLTERLGFAWDDVHDEAERLEHAASDRLIEAMAAALGHPSHDPHGAPIPTASGEIEVMDLPTLAQCAPGDTVTVRAVPDEDGEALRAMESRGVGPGVMVTVGPPPADGEGMVLRVDGDERPLAVAREVAHRILVARDDTP
ncbi:metal-dependent transcriptional regulator [Gaopeijia maritima]|uniref:Transcriptional regulator MntR n=1 Tax=Gaopeijia maritima TaxID=3119007 RepID=A0ABU9E9I5_9BACT